VGRILVVGGAGYVGCVLAEELLARGNAVRILDRLYFGRSGLRDIEDRVEVVAGDMRQVEESVLDDIDAVINCGGLSNDPTAEHDPKANVEINTVSTHNLARICKDHGIHRYIFASSCSIYDTGLAEKDVDMIQDETSSVNPKAAYSSSKYEAEKLLLDMADDSFCPVILRKGTVFGFSNRMRYDLVVNTFVKDALSRGRITIHYGGEMWRPLVDVRDVARAYVACLQADEDTVRGQIFNVGYRNFRISEVAYRVRKALEEIGINTEIDVDYGYKGIRSYRVSSEKIERVLNFRAVVSIEESVKDMVERIRSHGYDDFDNPRYYNIRWMQLLEEAQEIINITGHVFD